MLKGRGSMPGCSRPECAQALPITSAFIACSLRTNSAVTAALETVPRKSRIQPIGNRQQTQAL